MIKKRRDQKNSPSPHHGGFSRSRRRRRYHRATGEKSPAEKRYFHSLEQYWVARRKYFELFHRAQGRKLDRLKNNFYRALSELRELEKGLKMKGKAEDLTYSHNHQLDPHSPAQESAETMEKSEEFYILESQKENNYGDDVEESVGSMEDYLAYKSGKA